MSIHQLLTNQRYRLTEEAVVEVEYSRSEGLKDLDVPTEHSFLFSLKTGSDKQDILHELEEEYNSPEYTGSTDFESDRADWELEVPIETGLESCQEILEDYVERAEQLVTKRERTTYQST